MSNLDNEIKRLSEAAIDIAMLPNPQLRHKGGWWLHGQLDSLFESHLFTEDQRIEFMVVVKILVDVIFRDAVEGGTGFIPPPDESKMVEMMKTAQNGHVL